MAGTTLYDAVITISVLGGIFFMIYMAYRQQGILDTVNEIRDIFREKTSEALETGGVYK